MQSWPVSTVRIGNVGAKRLGLRQPSGAFGSREPSGFDESARGLAQSKTFGLSEVSSLSLS